MSTEVWPVLISIEKVITVNVAEVNRLNLFWVQSSKATLHEYHNLVHELRGWGQAWLSSPFSCCPKQIPDLRCETRPDVTSSLLFFHQLVCFPPCWSELGVLQLQFSVWRQRLKFQLMTRASQSPWRYQRSSCPPQPRYSEEQPENHRTLKQGNVCVLGHWCSHVVNSQCFLFWQLPSESQVNNNTTQNSLTEEQRAEAETLKTDGRTRRKLFLISASSQMLADSQFSLWFWVDVFCLTGNDQMKVENFSAAVEFYSKAIAINPQNAVYYCNRSVCCQHSATWHHSQPPAPCDDAVHHTVCYVTGMHIGFMPFMCCLCSGLLPSVNWGTMLERCKTASRPLASTQTTAKPMGGWGMRALQIPDVMVWGLLWWSEVWCHGLRSGVMVSVLQVGSGQPQ